MLNDRESKLNENGRRVAELRKNNPSLRTSEIGKIVGLSRERVRQILVSVGLPTTVEKHVYRCQICGKEVSKMTVTCMDCIREKAWVTVQCATCGKDKKVRSSTYRYRRDKSTRYKSNYYCDRTCFYNRQNPFNKESP